MAFAALIPLIASAIPAVMSAFGGGGGGGGGAGGGNQGGGRAPPGTEAALGAALSQVGAETTGKGGGIIADHPVTKGTDLPPILAAMLTDKLPSSGHVTAAKLGQRGVLAPHLEQALSHLHTTQAAQGVKTHQEKAARAQVRRVNATVQPQLKAIHEDLKHRAAQVQATAEHRQIVQGDQRYQEIRGKLDSINTRLDAIDRKLRGNWARY